MREHIILFWTMLGIGILLKGPPAPLLAIATMAALWDRGFVKFLRPLPYLLIPVLMVAPWLYAIQVHTDGAFLRESLGHDFLGKVKEGQESHGMPFGYYLLLSPLLLWPTSLLVLPALTKAKSLYKEPISRFALAWLIPYWLLLETTPTKLPHYLLPLAPALCLLAVQTDFVKNRLVTSVWLIGTLALALAIPALPLMRENTLPFPALLAAAGLVILIISFFKLPRLQFIPIAIVTAIVTYGAVFNSVLPSLKSVFLSEEICRTAAGRPVFSAGYDEPSLVFRCGTNTKFGDAYGAYQFSYAEKEGVIAVSEAHQPTFQRLLNNASIPFQRIKTIRGFNYNEGEETRITLYAHHQ